MHWIDAFRYVHTGQAIPISSGRTQTSSMSIISSSPLREGILSQAQEFVSDSSTRLDRKRMVFFT
jgi:hypothetical protein